MLKGTYQHVGVYSSRWVHLVLLEIDGVLKSYAALEPCPMRMTTLLQPLRRVEVAAITAAFKWLSGTSVARAIMIDSQLVLHRNQTSHICHEWVPGIDNLHLKGLL